MYRGLENIIPKDSQISINCYDNEIPVNQKSTNIEITNENMCCKYCTESLCFDMQKNNNYN